MRIRHASPAVTLSRSMTCWSTLAWSWVSSNSTLTLTGSPMPRLLILIFGQGKARLERRSSWRGRRLRSLGVVEDDPERVALPRPHAADAVAELDAVHAARPLNGALVDGEDDAVASPERHHHGPRLHAGPLLRHHELAAREVLPGRGEECRELERKDVLPVEVLMEAVVVAGPVLEEERRRPRLAGRVAALDELPVLPGV